MIETLSSVFGSIKNHNLQLLYVDGNSPDGTANLIRQKQSKFPWLHLIVETKKEGLGAAYAKGFVYAMDTLKADFVGEMDTDFQHRPDDLPKLISKIDSGYDFIIGSRYIPGGSIPKEWELSRKFLSVAGNLFARLALFMPKVHDVTGGFRISRARGFLDKFNFSTLLSKSFAYKIHILHHMIISCKSKFIEVPIIFEPRSAGESKIIKNELFETLRVVFLLQTQNAFLKRFTKFGFVGLLGLFIQTLIFELVGLKFKLLPPFLATFLGGEIAVISNFTFNNAWTFNDHKISNEQIFKKFVHFNLTSLLTLFFQTTVVKLTEHYTNSNHSLLNIAYFGSLILVIVFNFFVYNKFIWRTTKSQ
jgi:dolichol-phosphate mannosyltransferase